MDFFVGYDMTIYKSEYSITTAQYQCLEELINDILKYEKENDVKIFNYNIEKKLVEAKRKIVNSYESDEVIITKPTKWSKEFSGEEVMDGRPHNFKNVKQYNVDYESFGRKGHFC